MNKKILQRPIFELYHGAILHFKKGHQISLITLALDSEEIFVKNKQQQQQNPLGALTIISS